MDVLADCKPHGSTELEKYHYAYLKLHGKLCFHILPIWSIIQVLKDVVNFGCLQYPGSPGRFQSCLKKSWQKNATCKWTSERDVFSYLQLVQSCTYGSRLCVYIVICDKFTKPGGGTCTISPSSPGLLSGTCSASCSAPGTTAQASFSSMLSIARSCSHRCEVRIRCCLTGSKSKFQPEWPAISECYQHRLISCGK